MNRRGFFQTLLAAAAAIFLPKSKKAEVLKKSLSDGLVKIWVFDEHLGSNNDDVAVDIYAQGFDGTCRKLTKEELQEVIFDFDQSSKKAWDDHHKHIEIYNKYLAGQQWGITFPKETQNG